MPVPPEPGVCDTGPLSLSPPGAVSAGCGQRTAELRLQGSAAGAALQRRESVRKRLGCLHLLPSLVGSSALGLRAPPSSLETETSEREAEIHVQALCPQL